MTAWVHLGELGGRKHQASTASAGSVTAIMGFQVAKQAWHREFLSDAPERLGGRQACRADGGQQPGQGADDGRGGQPAGPGVERDDDGLAVGAGVSGDGGGADDDARSPRRAPRAGGDI
jgi:hypothetical protein